MTHPNGVLKRHARTARCNDALGWRAQRTRPNDALKQRVWTARARTTRWKDALNCHGRTSC
eukprot:2403809-Lingulodinium_polyedra.AAC.1